MLAAPADPAQGQTGRGPTFRVRKAEPHVVKLAEVRCGKLYLQQQLSNGCLVCSAWWPFNILGKAGRSQTNIRLTQKRQERHARRWHCQATVCREAQIKIFKLADVAVTAASSAEAARCDSECNQHSHRQIQLSRQLSARMSPTAHACPLVTNLTVWHTRNGAHSCCSCTAVQEHACCVL